MGYVTETTKAITDYSFGILKADEQTAGRISALAPLEPILDETRVRRYNFYIHC